MLWTDLQTMNEFFELDPVNEDFYEVYVTLLERPFQLHVISVKVFNEVYYQMTRMAYDHPLPTALDSYVADIKANLGWSYSAELVMTMVYFLTLLADRKLRLHKFFDKDVIDKFKACLYWKPFRNRCIEIKSRRYRTNSLSYKFNPRPNPVNLFKDKYIRWSEITQKFDLSCIEHVINLWNDINDQREIALLIKGSMSSIFGCERQRTEYQQVTRFIDKYLGEEKSLLLMKEVTLEARKSIKEKDIESQRAEKRRLLGRIEELKEEVDRLNALLEKKKRNGTARKFTLVEIVNYCKNCVEWRNVEHIVAMLNKLLRQIGTEEDSALVDSIETEFRNRIYGNVFNNPQITMESPQINGPINEIHSNQSVQLGGHSDEG